MRSPKGHCHLTGKQKAQRTHQQPGGNQWCSNRFHQSSEPKHTRKLRRAAAEPPEEFSGSKVPVNNGARDAKQQHRHRIKAVQESGESAGLLRAMVDYCSIQADTTAAGGGQEEKDEAVLQLFHAMVSYRPKSRWQMLSEVGDGHLAGKDQRYSTRQNAQDQQRRKNCFDDSRMPEQAVGRNRLPAKPSKQFPHAV